MPSGAGWSKMPRTGWNWRRRCTFDRYLPPHASILDAGGGPGRYTIELALPATTLSCLDMTPANLDFARRQIKRARVQKQVTGIVEGTIVDLAKLPAPALMRRSVPAGLRIVLDPADRNRAVDELLRAVKPGGIVAVSVMGRLSVLALELMLFPRRSTCRSTPRFATRAATTAVAVSRPATFLPEELAGLFAGKPAFIETMVGPKGPARIDKAVNRTARQPERWQRWLRSTTAPARIPPSSA